MAQGQFGAAIQGYISPRVGRRGVAWLWVASGIVCISGLRYNVLGLQAGQGEENVLR